MEDIIKEVTKSLRTLFEDRLNRQQHTIKNLQIRVDLLEHRLSYNQHITTLRVRKIDDLEQVSRKVNLKLTGIEVLPRDSPQNIMKMIIDEATSLDIGLTVADFDRCHRVGGIFWKQGIPEDRGRVWANFVN